MGATGLDGGLGHVSILSDVEDAAKRGENPGALSDEVLYIIHPEKSFPIQGGMYQYVRHAHYAEGIWMGIALGFLAKNWMGFIIVSMVVLECYGIARAEDEELIRRYGASFETYVRSKPMFFPTLTNLGGLVKLVLTGS